MHPGLTRKARAVSPKVAPPALPATSTRLVGGPIHLGARESAAVHLGWERTSKLAAIVSPLGSGNEKLPLSRPTGGHCSGANVHSPRERSSRPSATCSRCTLNVALSPTTFKSSCSALVVDPSGPDRMVRQRAPDPTAARGGASNPRSVSSSGRTLWAGSVARGSSARRTWPPSVKSTSALAVRGPLSEASPAQRIEAVSPSRRSTTGPRSS